MKLILSAFVGLLAVEVCVACSNFLITKGASVEGYNMISYAADSHVLYGALYHFDAGKYPNGTMMDIIEWDTGHYLGQIPQAAQTYNVIGNINEFAVSIGETTYGGLDALQEQPGAIVDYGSLIYIALQRSKSAREAITVMTDLVAKYGYASEGESFSLADPNEVWIMEMIGKGKFEKGAVWVAVRIPDGYVSGHANQARIRTFPLNDPANCVYSSDVITFARQHGFYNGVDADFSFSDVYNPVSFTNARGCEARVWSMFRRVAPNMDDYVDYVTGKNLSHRMPLYVKVTKKQSVNDTMNYMRDHFENSALDFRTDVGAEAFQMPYRWRPLTWTSGAKTYTNERSIGTQQTGFVFVSQLRTGMPTQIGGVIWFGVDDSAMTIFAPFYCGSTRVPKAYASSVADMMTFSFDSAFWTFNLVSNFVYTRYNLIYPEVFAKISDYETHLIKNLAQTDARAVDLYRTNPTLAIEYITQVVEQEGAAVVSDWMDFFKYLFVRFMDGNVKRANPDPKERNPIVDWPGYGTAWYGRIVQDTGDRYLVPDTAAHTASPEQHRKLKGM